VKNFAFYLNWVSSTSYIARIRIHNYWWGTIRHSFFTINTLSIIPDRRISELLCSITHIIVFFPVFTARELAQATGKVISLSPVVGNLTRLMTRHCYMSIETMYCFHLSPSRALNTLKIIKHFVKNFAFYLNWVSSTSYIARIRIHNYWWWTQIGASLIFYARSHT
jgi:CDP-diglyceride synthetase